MSDIEERHGFVTTDGVRLHYTERGEGPAVVMLHGFPDTRRSFELQVPALLQAGYRVITPDLRGYGESDRPPAGYDLDSLTNDICGLVEHLGAPLRIVGHDWGGGIAWHLASRHPRCVSRLVILNAPHPVIMARALQSNRRQIRRSWYFFFFQLPKIPERWLTKDRGRNIGRMFRVGSPAQHDAPTSIVDEARRALTEPGAIGPPVEYYRASVRGGLLPTRRREFEAQYAGKTVDCPVTIIWGTHDTCLGTELLDGTERYAPGVTIHRIDDAGHFVHQERASAVNPLLLDALADQPMDDAPSAHRV